MAKRPRGESSGGKLKISSGVEASSVVVKEAGQSEAAVSSQRLERQCDAQLHD